MQIEKSDRRSLVFCSLLVAGALLLLISTMSGSVTARVPFNHPPAEIKLATGNINMVSGLLTVSVLKTWISNDADFRILSFKEIQFLENRKTSIRIYRIAGLFREYHNISPVREQIYPANQGIEPPPVLS